MKNILFICFLSFFFSSVYSQSSVSVLSNYVRNVNRFSVLNPQEKVWLHFDNTGYYIGETIWFKAYVVGAAYHDTTFLSRVLHVELLTPEGMVVDSRKLRIENGGCHGEFRLKGEYRSGFYEVRAYTRSMLNFGDGCVFSRVFPVYSEPEVIGDYADKKMDAGGVLINMREKPEKRGRINMSFYPEGGHAIAGLASRIAFRASGDDGSDLDIRGRVYNERGESVASFGTLHQGMGFFELTPEHTSYKVVAECGGRKRTFSLEGILPAGYVMRADHLNDSVLQVRIAKSSSLPADTIGFSVSCRGVVYSAETFLVGDSPVSFPLSLPAFPAGCLQLTLFNRDGSLLAERLVFNRCNSSYLTVSCTPDKAFYQPLERIALDLDVRDGSGKPVSACFSLSVCDASSGIVSGYQDNILTGLLLSSDVRGYIENPMQYFVDRSRTTRAKLDLLMLVQGWRRYNWEVMSGVAPFGVKHFAEECLDISGRVLDYRKDLPVSGVTVTYWMSRDGRSLHGKCRTDSSGCFYFALPDHASFRGKWPLSLGVTAGGKRRHCRILLDRSGPLGRAYTYEDGFVQDTIWAEPERPDSLNKSSVTEMQYLDEVGVKKNRLKSDIVLDVEKDINVLKDRGDIYPSTVGEYLKRCVSVVGDSPGYKFANQKTYYCYQYLQPEIPDKLKGMSITSIEIEKVYEIEIYYSNLFAWKHVVKYGNCLPGPTGPAVFVWVRLYDDGFHEAEQVGVRQTFFSGYSQVKEFYHVDNSKKLPGEADSRRTLYWNPEVRSDSNGKARINFYNNSSCQNRNVTVGGITARGLFIIKKEDILNQ